MSIPFEEQRNAVIQLLQVEGQLTRRCLIKKLGFVPDIPRLIRDKVIRAVNGTGIKYELVSVTDSD